MVTPEPSAGPRAAILVKASRIDRAARHADSYGIGIDHYYHICAGRSARPGIDRLLQRVVLVCLQSTAILPEHNSMETLVSTGADGSMLAARFAFGHLDSI